MKHINKTLPRLALLLCEVCDGWIVGGAAKENLKVPPRDYDILVPFSNWPQASALIPSTAKPNRFGGWKVLEDGKEIDVWPDDLGRVMQHTMATVAYHPKSGTRLSKV